MVVTRIIKKEKAQEKYEDAVAGGDAAIMAETISKEKTLVIKLGNLLPEQSATLKI